MLRQNYIPINVLCIIVIDKSEKRLLIYTYIYIGNYLLEIYTAFRFYRHSILMIIEFVSFRLNVRVLYVFF